MLPKHTDSFNTVSVGDIAQEHVFGLWYCIFLSLSPFSSWAVGLEEMALALPDIEM